MHGIYSFTRVDDTLIQIVEKSITAISNVNSIEKEDVVVSYFNKMFD